MFESYVYVGSRFSSNTTDILTNITCYIVNTLIKDATLSVWDAWGSFVIY